MYQADAKVDREGHRRVGLMEETELNKEGSQKYRKCLDI